MMFYLSEIDGQVDFVERHASREGRALPPPITAIDSKFWRMLFTLLIHTVVTNLESEVEQYMEYKHA